MTITRNVTIFCVVTALASACGLPKEKKKESETSQPLTPYVPAERETCSVEEFDAQIDKTQVYFDVKMFSDGYFGVSSVFLCSNGVRLQGTPSSFNLTFETDPSENDFVDKRDKSIMFNVALDSSSAPMQVRFKMPWADIEKSPEKLKVGEQGLFELKQAKEIDDIFSSTARSIQFEQWNSDPPPEGVDFKNIRRHDASVEFQHTDTSVMAGTDNDFEKGIDAKVQSFVSDSFFINGIPNRVVNASYEGKEIKIPLE